jgi:hypothetical protein
MGGNSSGERVNDGGVGYGLGRDQKGSLELRCVDSTTPVAVRRDWNVTANGDIGVE